MLIFFPITVNLTQLHFLQLSFSVWIFVNKCVRGKYLYFLFNLSLKNTQIKEFFGENLKFKYWKMVIKLIQSLSQNRVRTLMTHNFFRLERAQVSNIWTRMGSGWQTLARTHLYRRNLAVQWNVFDRLQYTMKRAVPWSFSYSLCRAVDFKWCSMRGF